MDFESMLKGMTPQKCCANHARTWGETYSGSYPASNHSPWCRNFKQEPFFRVVASGTGGPACILATQAEVDDLCDGAPEEYDVTVIQLTRDQFERLGEFEGF